MTIHVIYENVTDILLEIDSEGSGSTDSNNENSSVILKAVKPDGIRWQCSGSGQATTTSTITCIPNSALAIQSRALAVLAVRQQNIYCSPAPSASHSERESGQTTLP